MTDTPRKPPQPRDDVSDPAGAAQGVAGSGAASPRSEMGPIGKPAGRRATVIAALAVVAVAAVLAGVLSRHGSVTPGPPPSAPADAPPPADRRAEARALVEARLRQATDYAPFFQTLDARLPADAAQIRDGFVEKALSDQASATPDRLVADALKSLRETRGVVAAKADAPAMTRVFEAQGAMLSALRESDAKLCVDFAYGGATDALMAFSIAHRLLFADLAKANLDAILDGAEKKLEREPATDDDFAALEKALRDKDLGDVEVAALLDGKTPDPPLSDERMCDAARLYVGAVLALPEPARSRVLSLAIELMARS
jgi:hypothetical protein